MNNPICIYLSPYDILRPRTNQVSDVRFCEGFSQNNCEVHLVTPFVYRNDNIKKEDVNKIYELESEINIRYLATPFKKDISGIWKTIYIAVKSIFKVLRIINNSPSTKEIFILSRSAPLIQAIITTKKLFPWKFKKSKIVFWAHDFKEKPNYFKVYKKSDALLVTNSSIKEDLCKKTGIKPENVFVTLNPITEYQANQNITKKEARIQIGLNDIIETLIVYTGKLAIDYNKELIYILKAVKLNKNVKLLCTGGKPEVINYWKNWCIENNIENILFTGYISDYSKIKYYQYAADILISYYTNQGHDVRYNFPNKLCEYMLTGNIIITPDYPATKDILNSSNCMFAVPENEEELSKTIQYIISNFAEMNVKANKAKLEVRKYTFKERNKLILSFLRNINDK